MTAPKSPKPRAKPGARSMYVEDFGEQTYARALKAVTEAITDVEQSVKTDAPAKKQQPKLAQRRRPPSRSK